jgi:hypothetical protein
MFALGLRLIADVVRPLSEMRYKRHIAEPIKFRCPNCETEYKVDLVEAPPTQTDPLLCLSCGAPLQNRQGKFARCTENISAPTDHATLGGLL